jgi:hypothetical protein
MDLINKVNEFDGKPENWNKWSKTFLAKASLRGYKTIIKNQEPYPAEALIPSSDDSLPPISFLNFEFIHPFVWVLIDIFQCTKIK